MEGNTRNLRQWSGLRGSSLAYVLAKELQEIESPALVLCPTEDQARAVFDELSFFSGLFPADLTLHRYSERPTDLDPSRLPALHIAWKRVSTLSRLIQQPEKTVVVTSLHAAVQKTLPIEFFLTHTGVIKTETDLDIETFTRNLIAAGYDREPRVEEPGTLAIRGGVIDLFSPHMREPVRLEFFGDTVESIKTFDPQTQRTLKPLEETLWMPCREILFDSAKLETYRSRLKNLSDRRNLPPAARLEIDEALRDGRYSPLMESLFPLFFPEGQPLTDYLPKNTTCIQIDPFAREQREKELEELFVQVAQSHETESRLAYDPAELAVPFAQFSEWAWPRTSLQLADVLVDTPENAELQQHAKTELHEHLSQSLQKQSRSPEPLAPLLEKLSTWKENGSRVLWVARSDDGAKRIQNLLQEHLPSLPVIPPAKALRGDAVSAILLGDLKRGFDFESEHLVFLTEEDLFGERKHSATKEVSREDFFGSVSELTPGDPIVHIDFGVGVYRGLERMTIGPIANDFLHIEFAGQDKLYLPVDRLNRIQKYLGADRSHPKLDRLGNKSAWAKTKKKAQKAVEEMARELIELYAKRKVSSQKGLGAPDATYASFENSFPFDETPDQQRAIQEVNQDLESDKPTDRLICGDVGFGKTEVALRAAFRAAMEGRQVALLVPTTVLAQQHYETFKDRLKDYPVTVDFLSRFKSKAEQKTVLEELAKGTLDIVIGTHRLLSQDVRFSQLGLLVIDEEHRFGVKHKERIKEIRANVDVLTLTATPIPRTLQMSIAGIRDLSVINTPPLDRKAIATYLCKFEDPTIRGAVLKETNRGGQVFFVHNRVETINAVGRYLQRLLPEVKIEIAHGQMNERTLEKQILRFMRHEYDVLLCTTIIESGLDIPNANTIIVNRADTFGLAQLYQLRGRVGRSTREAYAYLLVPAEDLVGQQAYRRLKVLKRFTDLGSGLKIALHDLEIRGAGNLLGSKQSGHIAAIGLELYTQLLEKEVRRLKGEKVEEDIDPEVRSDIPSFIPEDYVDSTGERLLLYKRLASAKNEEEQEELKSELVDRFGAIPPTVKNLFNIIELKILARRAGASVLSLSGSHPFIQFTDRAAPHLNKILDMIQRDRRLQLTPTQRLVISLAPEQSPTGTMKEILNQL